ncbi:hypothetical protein FDP41_005633 [Naegleria fowleri]|uniref:Uncharacterized protein n=1 Tax=Naegleria fowleri TaxID=5763 RepID=A0A6A5BRT3_NAEFO|nr:uncharacterized protein FDP41_005633 [Naegleria fowleri]KAF0975639.1 hypothetical protein FDP41_005633 [Naegleria fowleri]
MRGTARLLLVITAFLFLTAALVTVASTPPQSDERPLKHIDTCMKTCKVRKNNCPRSNKLVPKCWKSKPYCVVRRLIRNKTKQLKKVKHGIRHIKTLIRAVKYNMYGDSRSPSYVQSQQSVMRELKAVASTLRFELEALLRRRTSLRERRRVSMGHGRKRQAPRRKAQRKAGRKNSKHSRRSRRLRPIDSSIRVQQKKRRSRKADTSSVEERQAKEESTIITPNRLKTTVWERERSNQQQKSSPRESPNESTSTSRSTEVAKEGPSFSSTPGKTFFETITAKRINKKGEEKQDEEAT